MSVRLAPALRRRGLPTVDRRLLRRRAGRVLAALGAEDRELSVSLTGDPEIAELNEAWRGRSGPTDVLSFSLDEGEHTEFRGALLGDVVVGLGVAARQAEGSEASLDDEVARLVIHGVLHLLGHDHREPGEARRMRAEERRLWRVLADD
jgi:probable rRNA maturation factor